MKKEEKQKKKIEERRKEKEKREKEYKKKEGVEGLAKGCKVMDVIFKNKEEFLRDMKVNCIAVVIVQDPDRWNQGKRKDHRAS